MIYLLEDDDSIRKLIVYALNSQGFEVQGLNTPGSFWRQMKESLPELILLDIMLPEEDGLSILKKLRQNSSTASLPVIILTSKNSEYDRVAGLNSGADDYISKPFGMMELIARVRAVLRRTHKEPSKKEYHIGPLFLCPDRHEILLNGEQVRLTYKEFALLCLLAENRGIVLSRSMLMDRVWGMEASHENRTLDVHIRTLRAKMGEAGSYIETVRGLGYRLLEETYDS